MVFAVVGVVVVMVVVAVVFHCLGIYAGLRIRCQLCNGLVLQLALEIAIALWDGRPVYNAVPTARFML